MNKRNKTKLYIYLSTFLIVIGTISTIFVVNTYLESQKKMKVLIKNRAEFNSSEDETELIVNDGVSEDQVVEQKDGTPIVSIPRLSILAPIVEGTDSSSLKVGAGHFTDLGIIGEVGNYCIAGHSSSVYNCIFNNLKDIALYDEVKLFNSSGDCFTYFVVSKEKVSPEATYVLAGSDSKMLTIITCTDNGSMRLCVKALCLSAEELQEYKIKNSQEKIILMKDIVNKNEVDILKYFKN